MPPAPLEQPRPPILPPDPGAKPVGKTVPIEARLDTQEAIGGLPRRRGLKNSVLGKRHEDIVGWWLEKVYGAENVATQVHIRAYDKTGKAWTHNKVVVDYVVRDPATGKLLYWDGKTTPGALKHGQERVYGLLEQYGGEIRSAERMPDWLKVGQDVAPGKVTFAYKSYPQEIGKLKDALRGTGNRGIGGPSGLLGAAQTDDVARGLKSAEKIEPRAHAPTHPL
jgi:hypothetical protein